jgi:serine phosphatase RsbU (regulator of sigma subunit)
VAPFHPLRHDARAFTARAGAAFVVFLTIAFVLLAGGSDQPLASAEANKGDTGAGDAAVLGQNEAPIADAPAPEPVLGAVPPEEAPPAEIPPVEAPPAEVPPAEAPPEQAPPAEAPAGGPSLSGNIPDGDDEGSSGDKGRGGDDDDDEGSSGGGKGRGDDDEGSSGGGKGRGDDDDEGDGGGRGDDDDEGDDDEGDDDGEPSGGGPHEGETPPPSGGGKGQEPGSDDGDNDGDDEPGLSGRPQVTLPASGEGGEGSGGTGDVPVVVSDPAPSDGTFELQDGSTRPGENPDQPTTASADQGQGSGDAPAGDGTGGAGAAPEDATGAEPGGTAASTPGTVDGAAGDGGGDAAGGAGGEGGESGDEGSGGREAGDQLNPVEHLFQPVERLFERVPDSLKAAIAALAALSVLLGIGYLLAAMRARRLARQRRELLQEVGLLQTALLPPVPDKVGALLTSVAYRPADGPGAGGDFYDVLPLPGGRVGFILGDVSGHGRGALARTAFMRYTLRAYLEAGLEPRVALQVAGRVIDENLGGDFATVLLAVHDPETGSLTYATAGHPAPIVVGPQPHDPVTAGSSPPIGVGVRTGLRQTTVPLVPGSVAALFTDGLMEARTENGILGRERLAELLEELGDDPSARSLIESVAAESTLLSDDMAAVVVTPTAGVTAGLFRTEQLELSARELDGPIARRFLEATGLPEHEVDAAEREARDLADRFGGVVLHVVFGNRLSVEVLPRNVESIEAASRRVSAGTAQ